MFCNNALPFEMLISNGHPNLLRLTVFVVDEDAKTRIPAATSKRACLIMSA